MENVISGKAKLPLWIMVTAVLGIAWNAFGLFQLYGSLTSSEAGLMMQGMSAEAARVYHNLPLWMNVAFAVGAGGGVLGCIALLLRLGTATAILGVSLVGYIILFAGDVIYGLFDLIPGQLAILSSVVAIAVILLGVAIIANRRTQ